MAENVGDGDTVSVEVTVGDTDGEAVVVKVTVPEFVADAVMVTVAVADTELDAELVVVRDGVSVEEYVAVSVAAIFIKCTKL